VPRAAIVDHIPDAPLPVELLVNGSLDAIERKVAARADTVLLLGPEYVLLRPEFARPPERTPADPIERVLVTTGGGDATGLSATLAGWVREVFVHAAIDVIVGPYFTPETVGALERAAQADARIVLHRNPRDVRAIMLGCDLALTGGGQTTYELAATGTPAVAVSVAENQTANLRGLAARGALQWAGRVGEPDLHGRTTRCLEALSDSVAARRDMSRAALAVVDGKGAERVAREILRMCREETT
jgi:spore coat polysaccharide biosynthesis predicted glycosyltransferase SpsG